MKRISYLRFGAVSVKHAGTNKIRSLAEVPFRTSRPNYKKRAVPGPNRKGAHKTDWLVEDAPKIYPKTRNLVW